MHFEAYGASRPQEGRSGNEDAFAILRDGPLVAAVADGAGAAGRAAAGVLRRFGRWVVEDGPEALERFPSWSGWIGALDSSILGGSESTFLALAALAGPGPRRGRLVGAWVGDSRAYRIDREGGVELLTDGSSRFRLGSGRVEPRPIHRPVEPGELVLLLTDGAWTPLAGSPYRLGRLVMEAALRHLSEVPPAILDAASRAGRADDMTAVVVRGRAARGW
jgi:serine/threonine protein phosphatase PrpC